MESKHMNSTRQANKLNWLDGNQATSVTWLDTGKIVVNLSSYKLSESELKLLSIGLKFSIPPHHLDSTDTMASFESLFNQTTQGVKGNLNRLKHRFKSLCYQYIYNNRSNFSNLSKEEHIAFKGLLKNPNIVISKPDKGNGIVILNRTDYINKLETITNDSTKFTQLIDDPTDRRESRLQNFLYRLHKKGQLDDATYKQIRPTGSNPSKLYGLPKIHKEGTPLRPIISQIGSYTYELAKFLVPILSPLASNKYSIKDSFSFVQDLLTITSAPYMCSFDVVSLFTNIPLEETIEICLNKLYATTDKVHNITKDNLRKLILYASKGNQFIFDNKYFDQIDGVSMGSPLGPILANIFTCHFESTAIAEYLGTLPLNYYRYVDDCFLIFCTKAQCDVFFNYLNSRHPNIKFTKEVENDNSLPFLDIKIIRDEHSLLSTSVYHEPTFSGLYLQWKSFVPKQYKISLVNCLLYRAWRICSDSRLFNNEVGFIKSTLMANGYPTNFLNSCIHKFKQIRHSTHPKEVSFGPKLKDIYIRLPYKGQQSITLKRQLNRIINKIAPWVKLNCVFFASNRISRLCKLKCSLPVLKCSHLIYIKSHVKIAMNFTSV